MLPRNFFIRVKVGQDRASNLPKSRPYLTLETFNLSVHLRQKLNQLVEENINTSAKIYDKHVQTLANCQGIMYALPGFFDGQDKNCQQRPADQSSSPKSSLLTSSAAGMTNMITPIKVGPNISAAKAPPVHDGSSNNLLDFHQHKTTPIANERGKRHKRRKRPNKKVSNDNAHFNATTSFKSYFDNFLQKEQ